MKISKLEDLPFLTEKISKEDFSYETKTTILLKSKYEERKVRLVYIRFDTLKLREHYLFDEKDYYLFNYFNYLKFKKDNQIPHSKGIRDLLNELLK